MIDFTGVKAVTIPQGSVKKITRGSTVLWEKPSVQNYEIVFPATEFSESDLMYWGEYTNVNGVELNRMPQVGEKHIVYLNGIAYEDTAYNDGGQICFCNTGIVYACTDSLTTKRFYVAITGVFNTVTLEIHYIPE